eukprot:1698688-Prymnesium_polylepis.1
MGLPPNGMLATSNNCSPAPVIQFETAHACRVTCDARWLSAKCWGAVVDRSKEFRERASLPSFAE